MAQRAEDAASAYTEANAMFRYLNDHRKRGPGAERWLD